MKRDTKRRRTGGRKPSNRSVSIQITTTPQLAQVLDLVVATGFFGGTRATAAERLLAEGLRAQLKEGTIQRRKKAVEN